MSETQVPSAPPLSLTDSAVERIAFLREKEGNPNLMLRVTVSGGGCSGFQYGFSFAEDRNEDDEVLEKGGIVVLVDTMSLMYLAGAQIDFIEDMIGSSFAVTNPNATASCSCGSSFAVG